MINVFNTQQLLHWKTFEKNNPTIALNILYTKETDTLPTYIAQPVKNK